MAKYNKVVFNKCYGGYSLSDEAIDWLAEHGSERTRQFIVRKRLEAYGKTKDCDSRVRLTSDSTEKFYVMKAVTNFLERHDPDLVAVVESLGDRANGTFAELSIEQIEGNVYLIEEYDGKETIIVPDDICWNVIQEAE